MANPPKQAAPKRETDNLYCNEKMAAQTAEIFTDPLPGVWHLNANDVLQPGGRPANFRTDLEPEDVKLVNELGRLSPDQLMEYIRHLQSSAFNLGNEEHKQFTKAKVLQIFPIKDV